MLKGITIELAVQTQTGVDPFGHPIMEVEWEVVDDVLVSPSSPEDIVSAEGLYGKRAEYTLAIPKGDIHKWTDTEVRFFGQTFRTFGPTIEGIEANIPLRWNKKVMVERYG